MAWRVKEVGDEADKAIVEVEGVVDSTNVEDFFGFINSIFKKGTSRIVIDLDNASYISSGGLSVIIDAYKRAGREGGKLVIARTPEMVTELFEVAQFEKVIEFYNSLDEALEAL